MLHDLCLKLGPVISLSRKLLPPEVKLEHALREGRALECFIWPLFDRLLHAALHACMVDSFEYFLVDDVSTLVLEWDLEHH